MGAHWRIDTNPSFPRLQCTLQKTTVLSNTPVVIISYHSPSMNTTKNQINTNGVVVYGSVVLLGSNHVLAGCDEALVGCLLVIDTIDASYYEERGVLVGNGDKVIRLLIPDAATASL
jgi:hypothetical protein